MVGYLLPPNFDDWLCPSDKRWICNEIIINFSLIEKKSVFHLEFDILIWLIPISTGTQKAIIGFENLFLVLSSYKSLECLEYLIGSG